MTEPLNERHERFIGAFEALSHGDKMLLASFNVIEELIGKGQKTLAIALVDNMRTDSVLDTMVNFTEAYQEAIAQFPDVPREYIFERMLQMSLTSLLAKDNREKDALAQKLEKIGVLTPEKPVTPQHEPEVLTRKESK